MEKIKKEVPQRVQEWIKDLRSGEFSQCRNELQLQDSYCCLGVACKTYERLEGSEELQKDIFGELVGLSLINQEAVLKYFNFKHVAGMFDRSNTTEAPSSFLVDLNDDYEWSFEQIADFVEQNWEHIFDVPEEERWNKDLK